MASEIIRTVKSSGGDYSSLSAWEAGEQRDLVAADEIAVAECYSMQDTSQVTILGWTTDATRYIDIKTPVAERHDGKWNTAKYRLEVNASGTGVIVINEDNVRLEGLQIRHADISPSGTECAIRVLSTGGTTDLRVSYCILRDGRYTVRLSSGSNHYWWNNIIYGGTVGGLVTTTYSGIILDIYSCTIIGGDTQGIARSVGVVTAKNCYAYASGSGVAYSGTIGKTTCASDDTTGSAGLQNIAYDTSNFTNVTAGSEDLHIPSGSDLIDVGTDTSGEAAPMDFTDDIDGDARGATWDVGADELVDAGVTVSPSPGFCIAATIIGGVVLGSVTVIPSPSSVVASRVNPTIVLGSVSVTPSPSSCIASVIDPTVITGGDINITPTPVNCITERINPVITLGSIIVIPSPVGLVTAIIDPTVALGAVSVAPQPSYCIAVSVDPTVAIGTEGITVIPVPASCIAGRVNPVIILGSVLVLPLPTNVITVSVNPSVGLGSISITPQYIDCITERVNPTVTIGGLIIIPNPTSAICEKVNPNIILGSIIIIPQPVWVIVTSYDPTVIAGGIVISKLFKVPWRRTLFKVTGR